MFNEITKQSNSCPSNKAELSIPVIDQVIDQGWSIFPNNNFAK